MAVLLLTCVRQFRANFCTGAGLHCIQSHWSSSHPDRGTDSLEIRRALTPGCGRGRSGGGGYSRSWTDHHSLKGLDRPAISGQLRRLLGGMLWAARPTLWDVRELEPRLKSDPHPAPVLIGELKPKRHRAGSSGAVSRFRTSGGAPNTRGTYPDQGLYCLPSHPGQVNSSRSGYLTQCPSSSVPICSTRSQPIDDGSTRNSERAMNELA